MNVLRGAAEPTDDFHDVLRSAVRGAPRWPAPSGTHAAQLIAEQEHVERFARALWVQAWAAGAAWTSARLPSRLVLCGQDKYEAAKRLVADSWAKREEGTPG